MEKIEKTIHMFATIVLILTFFISGMQLLGEYLISISDGGKQFDDSTFKMFCLFVLVTSVLLLKTFKK